MVDEHPVISAVSQFQLNPIIIIQPPCACLCPRNRTVSLQLNQCGFRQLAGDLVAVVDEFVSAGDFFLGHFRYRLAGIAIRCRNRPVVAVLERLMDTHFMRLAFVREAGMEHEKFLISFGIDVIGIVSRRQIADAVPGSVLTQFAGEQEVPDQFVADSLMVIDPGEIAYTFVEGFGIDGFASCCIHVRSCDRLRTELSHLVAAVRRQSTICQIKIIIACFFVVDGISPFRRTPIPGGDLGSEITVDHSAVLSHAVFARVKRNARLFVQFKNEGPARPRTIRHPQFPLLVVQDIGIDGVRVFRIVVDTVFREPLWIRLFQYALFDQLIDICALPLLVDVTVRIIRFFLRESGIDDRIDICVGSFDILGHSQADSRTNVSR